MNGSDMIETLLPAILAIASTACLIATSVHIFLACRGGSSTFLSAADTAPQRLPTIGAAFVGRKSRLSWKQRIFLVMSAVGFIVCLLEGAQAMLFWMPNDWGVIDEENSVQAFKWTVTGIFAIFGGLAIFQLTLNATKSNCFLRIIEKQMSLERRIHKAATPDSLNSLHDEFIKKRDELKSAESSSLDAYGPITVKGLELDMYREVIQLVKSRSGRCL